MKVSVVVPVKDEKRLIEPFLEMVLQQTQLPQEVIVVDNNSTDETMVLAKKWAERYASAGSQLVLLSCIHGNQAEARAMAFGTAKHPVIVSLDVDVVLPKNWITRAVKAFERNPELVGAGGPMTYQNRLITLVHDIGFAFFSILSGGYSFYGSHAAFRKKAYQDSGGLKRYREVADNGEYQEAFDDIYLSVQLKRVGAVKPLWSLRASGVYRVRGEQVSLLRQLVRQVRQPFQTIRFYRAAREVARGSDSVLQSSR